MPRFSGLSVYIGDEVGRPANPPASGLLLDDGGVLCRRFQRCLLRSPERFQDTIELPGQPALEVDWIGAGLTAGVAMWVRDRGVSGVLAASILMNGLEMDGELEAIRGIFAVHSLNVPEHVWATLTNEQPPVFLTVHPTFASLRDRSIATAAGALANSFFAMFGTSGE